MPPSIPTADLHTIVQDLQFLSQNVRGPAITKAELNDWAVSLAQADPHALSLPAVKRATSRLICLGYANAAFKRAVVPPFFRGPVALEVEDTGGYFLARILVTALLKTVPLEDSNKLELIQHALAVDDRYRHALEQLLPLA